MTVQTAAILLLVASCGGGATEPSGEVAATSTTGSQATTSSAPAAAPTTVPAATTATAAVDPLLQAVAGIAGSYEGEWRNTTFGSTGPIEITLTVEDDGTVTVEMDLGGFVFGESDPDPESMVFNISDTTEGATVESVVFGTMTLSIAGAGFQIDAPDVPSDSIASMQVVAAYAEGSFTGTYTIEFEGGGGAEGEFDATLTG